MGQISRETFFIPAIFDFLLFQNFIVALIYVYVRWHRTRKGHDCERRGNGTSRTVSDTCSRMVRRSRLRRETAPRGAARRDVAPYRACNMHVSIRTLSNISFRSIYPNALSYDRLLSRCELYSISRFPPVCRRRARHKQTLRCKKVSVPRTYRITVTRKKRQRQLAGRPGLKHTPVRRSGCAPAPGAFNRYAGARSCASCSIVRRGA